MKMFKGVEVTKRYPVRLPPPGRDAGWNTRPLAVESSADATSSQTSVSEQSIPTCSENQAGHNISEYENHADSRTAFSEINSSKDKAATVEDASSLVERGSGGADSQPPNDSAHHDDSEQDSHSESFGEVSDEDYEPSSESDAQDLPNEDIDFSAIREDRKWRGRCRGGEIALENNVEDDIGYMNHNIDLIKTVLKSHPLTAKAKEQAVLKLAHMQEKVDHIMELQFRLRTRKLLRHLLDDLGEVKAVMWEVKEDQEAAQPKGQRLAVDQVVMKFEEAVAIPVQKAPPRRRAVAKDGSSTQTDRFDGSSAADIGAMDNTPLRPPPKAGETMVDDGERPSQADTIVPQKRSESSPFPSHESPPGIVLPDALPYASQLKRHRMNQQLLPTPVPSSPKRAHSQGAHFQTPPNIQQHYPPNYPAQIHSNGMPLQSSCHVQQSFGQQTSNLQHDHARQFPSGSRFPHPNHMTAPNNSFSSFVPEPDPGRFPWPYIPSANDSIEPRQVVSIRDHKPTIPRQYLVLWSGDSHPVWETAEDIPDCNLKRLYEEGLDPSDQYRNQLEKDNPCRGRNDLQRQQYRKLLPGDASEFRFSPLVSLPGEWERYKYISEGAKHNLFENKKMLDLSCNSDMKSARAVFDKTQNTFHNPPIQTSTGEGANRNIDPAILANDDPAVQSALPYWPGPPYAFPQDAAGEGDRPGPQTQVYEYPEPPQEDVQMPDPSSPLMPRQQDMPPGSHNVVDSPRLLPDYCTPGRLARNRKRRMERRENKRGQRAAHAPQMQRQKQKQKQKQQQQQQPQVRFKPLGDHSTPVSLEGHAATAQAATHQADTGENRYPLSHSSGHTDTSMADVSVIQARDGAESAFNSEWQPPQVVPKPSRVSRRSKDKR